MRNIIKEDTEEQKEIAKRLQNFISLRNKIITWFSFIILVIYYVFIIAVGSIPDVIGARIGDSAITVGIVTGILIIITCFAMTGLYVFIANVYFDRDLDSIIKDMKSKNMIINKKENN